MSEMVYSQEIRPRKIAFWDIVILQTFILICSLNVDYLLQPQTNALRIQQ